MKIEQPSLGRTGVDSLSLSLDWHWEGGWTVRSGSRLSGSQEWRRHVYEALSDDEALQVVCELVAECLDLL
jgi:hypothetical protein